MTGVSSNFCFQPTGFAGRLKHALGVIPAESHE